MPDETPLVLLFTGHFEVRGSCAYTLRLLQRLSDYGVRAVMICSCADRVPADKRYDVLIFEYPYLETPLLNRAVILQIAKKFRPMDPVLLHVQTHKVARSCRRLSQALHIT